MYSLPLDLRVHTIVCERAGSPTGAGYPAVGVPTCRAVLVLVAPAEPRMAPRRRDAWALRVLLEVVLIQKARWPAWDVHCFVEPRDRGMVVLFIRHSSLGDRLYSTDGLIVGSYALYYRARVSRS